MTKEHPFAGFPTGFAVAISIVIPVLAGLPFAAPASGQTFAGSTEVVEIEVPVQVVRDGQPVRGLKAEDFELYEGRRELTVSGFRVADLAAPASQGTSRGAVPAAAQRRFLLLFDLAFSSPKAIVAAREAARGLVLKGLKPGDLVGVATYSTAHGAEVALGFTSDRRQVDAALDSLGAVRDPHGADPLRLVIAPAGKAGAAGSLAGASLEADTARSNDLLDAQGGQLASLGKQATRANEKAAVTALTRSESELARLLGSLPGRKQIVYFSEGFDSSFLTGSAAALPSAGGAAAGTTDAVEVGALQQQDRANQDFYLTDSEATAGSTQALNAVERMLEELRRADCVIQAVDIGGLRAGGDQSAGARTAGKDSLLAMARGTGGELIQNTNDLAGAIGGVLERTSVTYVLSFQPEKGAPGAYHKVRVELKNAPRGTRIASRAGYYSPRPYGQLNPLEKLFDASSRLMAGTEAGTIPGAVLAAAFRAAGEKAYVPVQIEVDGPALLAVPAGSAGGAGGGVLPLEVYAYALDASGAIQDFFYQSLAFDLDKAGAQLRQGGLRFFGHLDLAAGEYSVRTLIRNGASGAFSLRATALTVPAFGKGPALLPPLFPDPTANRWALVHEAPRGNPGGGAPPAYPFVARKQPFYPATRPSLAEGKETPLALIGYDLGAAAVQTAARILDGDGKEVAAGGVRVVQREAGADGAPDVLLAAFRPPRLPAGVYVLEVSVGAAGAAPAASRAAFVIPAVH
jgi:VWFA-related protein